MHRYGAQLKRVIIAFDEEKINFKVKNGEMPFFVIKIAAKWSNSYFIQILTFYSKQLQIRCFWAIFKAYFGIGIYTFYVDNACVVCGK